MHIKIRTRALLSPNQHGVIARAGVETNGILGKHGDGIDNSAEL